MLVSIYLFIFFRNYFNYTISYSLKTKLSYICCWYKNLVYNRWYMEVIFIYNIIYINLFFLIYIYMYMCVHIYMHKNISIYVYRVICDIGIWSIKMHIIYCLIGCVLLLLLLIKIFSSDLYITSSLTASFVFIYSIFPLATLQSIHPVHEFHIPESSQLHVAEHFWCRHTSFVIQFGYLVAYRR